MKNLVIPVLFLFSAVAGCNDISVPSGEDVPIMDVAATKKEDSTACAYWKCSTTQKLYMQKYVKSDGGRWHPAGAFKLDEGVGAFPLEDLDKYGSDGEAVSIENGFDPCPYCANTVVVGCSCGKTYCEKSEATSGTCPWCGSRGRYQSGTWGVGGGG